MAGVKHVKTKSGWKKVKLDPNLFGDENFCSLASFEELTDYEIVDGSIRFPKKVEEIHPTFHPRCIFDCRITCSRTRNFLL